MATQSLKKSADTTQKTETEKHVETEGPSKALQEAVEEIRKRAALDAIQKRVAERKTVDEKSTETPVGTSSVPSQQDRSDLEAIRNEYYRTIWKKIGERWTIPENLVKDVQDMETVIVLVIERDGKVQKAWFEKRSGNSLYDQMALRAIKKAVPFPPIPQKLSESTIEIAVRFRPN